MVYEVDFMEVETFFIKFESNLFFVTALLRNEIVVNKNSQLKSYFVLSSEDMGVFLLEIL